MAEYSKPDSDDVGTDVGELEYTSDSSLETAGTVITAQQAPAVSYRNMGTFSRRKALLISAAVMAVVLLLSGGAIAFKVRQRLNERPSAQSTTSVQDAQLEDVKKISIPGELKVGTESLLVNGDIITRGELKITSGGFQTSLLPVGLTADQKYSLPNATGTICLNINNCNFITQDQLTQLQQSIAAQTASAIQGIPAPAASASAATVESLQGLTGQLTLQGTANQITIGTSGSTIAFALPQDIATTSSPTFTGLTLTGYGPGQVLVGNGTNALLGVAPTAGAQCLVSTSTTSVVFGSCVGGPSAATVELNNLSNVAINTSLLPGPATIDLGSTLNPFRDLYLSGNATLSGTLTANSLQGNGSGITNLNASNLTTGTVDNARLTGSGALTVTAGNGLTDGGNVTLGGTTTLNIGAGDGIIVSADNVAVDSTVCRASSTCTGYAPGDGTNYIQNQAALFQPANFQIQSASPTEIGGVIKGAIDQTADLFQLQSDKAAYPVLGVGAGGVVNIRNADDNAAEFSIQNASGYTILGVDSTAISNIVTNRSFDVDTAGWQYSGTPGSIAQTVAQQHTGAGSLMVNTSANADNGAKYTTGNTNPTQLALETTYDISWYDKLDPAETNPFTTVVAAYSVDGVNEVNCTNQNTSTVVTTGWTRHNCTITTDSTFPSNNAYVVIKQTDATARIFYIDDVQIADPLSSRLRVTDILALAAGQVNGTKIYTLDSSGAMGGFSSMAMGTDGLARIAYSDATKANLKFIQCLSDDCQVKLPNPIANTFVDDGFNGVNSNADVGRFNSIALDPSNLPRFSYYDTTAADLKYAACVVQDCSSGTVIKKLAVTGSVGRYSQIAIGPDGYARIIYNDLTQDSLKFIRCPDASCTVPVDSAQTIDNNMAPGQANGSTALHVGANGVYIAYYDALSNRLKFAHCLISDPDCLSPTITTIEPTQNIGFAVSMAVGSDGLARLAYYRASVPLRPYFIRCQNADCSFYTVPKLIDNRGNYGQSISIGLDVNDWPRISYKNNATGNGNLLYAKCQDPDCNVITLPTNPVDSTANLNDSSLIITPINLPITPNATRIVYNDTITGDLRFAVLNTDSGGEEISGGFSLGSSAIPFNKLSVRAIDLQGGLVVNNAGRAGQSAISIRGGGTYINAQDESDNKNLVVTQDTFQFTATNETTNAFQISALNTSGIAQSILLVNSKSRNVGIKNVQPGFDLDVQGDINASSTLKVGGVTVCTVSGCGVAPGGTGYIQNGTTLQSANFAISSKVAVDAIPDLTAPTAVIQRVGGQTGSLLQVQDETGTGMLATIGPSGDIFSAGAVNANALQTASTTRIDSTGLLQNVSHGDAANFFTGGELTVDRGGTGTGTIPTDGQLLIGNGSGYTVASLTSNDSSISITTGPGTIDLSAPGLGSCSSCVSLQPTSPGSQQTGNININGTIIAGSANLTGGIPLALGTTGSSSGGIIFNGQSGGAITLQAPTSAITDYTLRLPTTQGGAGTVLQNDGSGNLSWITGSGLACSSCIQQVPATTLQNTITPTAAGVVGLTVNGTSGTAATALNVIQAGDATALNVNSSGTGNLTDLITTNAAANGALITVQSGSAGQYALKVVTNNGGTPHDALMVGADGKIGIGTASPYATLDIRDNNKFTATSNIDATPSAGNSNLLMLTTDPQATNMGATIGLGGSFDNGGSPWTFGAIKGAKENSVSGGTGGYLSFFTSSGTGFGPLSERMRINSSGFVGIGTTTPATALDIQGALNLRSMSAPALAPASQGRFYLDSTNGLMLSVSGGAYNRVCTSNNNCSYVVNGGQTGPVSIGTNDATVLSLRTNGSTKLTVTTSGRVGIGTATPSGDLDVQQLLNGDTVFYAKRATDSAPTGNFLQLQDAANVDLATIDITGNLTVKSAIFNGNITVNGHIITGNSSGTTTIAANTAVCGTGCTATIAGNDTSGVITVNTGTGVTAGTLGTVTFATAYGTAPRIVITPETVPTASIYPQYYYANTTTTFDLKSYNAMSDSKTYTFSYQIMQ